MSVSIVKNMLIFRWWFMKIKAGEQRRTGSNIRMGMWPAHSTHKIHINLIGGYSVFNNFLVPKTYIFPVASTVQKSNELNFH